MPEECCRGDEDSGCSWGCVCGGCVASTYCGYSGAPVAVACGSIERKRSSASHSAKLTLSSREGGRAVVCWQSGHASDDTDAGSRWISCRPHGSQRLWPHASVVGRRAFVSNESKHTGQSAARSIMIVVKRVCVGAMIGTSNGSNEAREVEGEKRGRERRGWGFLGLWRRCECAEKLPEPARNRTFALVAVPALSCPVPPGGVARIDFYHRS